MIEALLMTMLVTTPALADKTNSDELICLADNIYHEARNQSLAGQLAVALVTRNRVLDNRYPNTYCEVVNQGPTRLSWKGNGKSFPIKNRCQFSWYCDGKADTINNKEIYDKAKKIAKYVISNNSFDITEGSTHYHAYYITPEWAKTKTKIAKIEDHIFYRWEK